MPNALLDIIGPMYSVFTRTYNSAHLRVFNPPTPGFGTVAHPSPPANQRPISHLRLQRNIIDIDIRARIGTYFPVYV